MVEGAKTRASPSGIPLAGGASPWVVLGPVAALSVMVGAVLAEIDRRMVSRTTVGGADVLAPEERQLREAA
jgi:hypothetical protein